MSIKMLALGLLIARAVSLTFIIMVLRKQWRLLKLPIDKEIRTFRKVLFILSLAIVAGNIVPVIIDVLTLVVTNTGRPGSVRAISIAYAYSNATTAAISSILIWLMYRLASVQLDDSIKPVAKVNVKGKK